MSDLTLEQIATATEPQLREFLGSRVCQTRGCFSYSMVGIIYCGWCVYGTSELVGTIDLAAKQRLDKLTKIK